MKELTIEQKAKAYDEAFRIAQELYNDPNSSNVGKGYVCTVFPKLKGNDNERIRKGIESIIKHYRDNGETICPYPFVTIEEALAWLEKQDEKSIIIDVDKMVLKYSQTMDGDFGLPVNCQIRAYRQGINDALNLSLGIKKQGEQKPDDNVEPKFKVGDWVVYCGDTYQITGLNNNTFTLTGCDGSYFFNLVESTHEPAFHLWAIKDAKDGDVLVDNYGNVVIYQEPSTKLMYHSYCYGNHKYFIDMGGSHEIVGSYPATKEQCDTLFAKMKDAGYEWDAEKKELKKQDEIEIPFGANDSELKKVTYHIPKGFHAELEENKVVIKQGEQKPAWSEDDENMLRRVFDSLNTYAKNGYSILKSVVEEEINWLKSLKSRKLYVYNPYKAVVESIAKMCDKYENYMYDEKEAKDFLANVAVKCREAAEYDKKYIEK